GRMPRGTVPGRRTTSASRGHRLGASVGCMDRSARDRFVRARVARLATTRADGAPHAVPVAFALVTDDAGRDEVWTVVDSKPKTTRALRRLANIAAEPRVCLLVDHYDDDWSRLWWVRADGRASVLVDLEGPEPQRGLAALATKYSQYQADP